MAKIGTPRHCKRCGIDWFQRIAGTPKMCPACKSRIWDKEKVKKAA